MNVPLLDLKAQYRSIKSEIDEAVAAVFESQRFILGPVVEECEKAVAEFSGCKYGIGVSSGTDALLLSLMAAGIGPGDEVITTPYTFFATVGSIVRLGATPVFVDIDPATCNINPGLIRSRICGKTRAIIPVHLYGQMADMEPIIEIAGSHGVPVIEDAAQAIGAEIGGRRAGSMAELGCLSFFPSKNLGGAGDGGMILTNNFDRAEKLKCLRVHGSSEKYRHRLVGGNFRFDALQAAVVLVKLRHLSEWTEQRRKNAQRYDLLFAEAGLADRLVMPVERTGRHVFNQYVVRTQRRDDLKGFLTEQGVGTEVYYPVPLHMQECFAGIGGSEGDFPESEKAAKETLALPVYPELSDEQAEYVVKCIAAFYRCG